MPDLTILHTNDLHGKLTDRAADVIAQEKSSVGNCILLDAGDAVSSGNIYYRPGGEPILARMSDLGYDAMTMGNREFHFLAAGLESKVKLAKFPVLSANLHSKDGDIGPTVRPSVTLAVGGLRIVVFGLSVPMITKRMLASKFSPYWFSDPIDAAKSIVPQLRSQADVLIALTHIGLQTDLELAGAVSGIDLVVGGHTHATLAEARMVGGTAVVQAGWWGHCLGRTEITMPAAPGEPPHIEERLIDLRGHA
jgi:2',3'-cyclic-nucleotide 2'-phosphodiesterase (5'-nucleotidase family)